MQYRKFIETFQKYSTNALQAVPIPLSCATKQVPSVFIKTFPNIVSIIDVNTKKICTKPKQKIVIFSLQPVSVAVESTIPKQLNRIINPKHIRHHLCCCLGYVLLNEKEEVDIDHAWHHNQRSFFIDFTTGIVADVYYYLNLFSPFKPQNATIYGIIDQDLLTNIWATFAKQQNWKEHDLI